MSNDNRKTKTGELCTADKDGKQSDRAMHADILEPVDGPLGPPQACYGEEIAPLVDAQAATRRRKP